MGLEKEPGGPFVLPEFALSLLSTEMRIWCLRYMRLETASCWQVSVEACPLQCRWLLLMVFVGHFEVAVLYLVSFAHICVPLP